MLSAIRGQEPNPSSGIQGQRQSFCKSEVLPNHPTLKKLSEKYLGPFDIINQVGPLSWTLRLPTTMHAVHPVFHVSMLELSTLNSVLNHV
jgi:hypothetical protein